MEINQSSQNPAASNVPEQEEEHDSSTENGNTQAPGSTNPAENSLVSEHANPNETPAVPPPSNPARSQPAPGSATPRTNPQETESGNPDESFPAPSPLTALQNTLFQEMRDSQAQQVFRALCCFAAVLVSVLVPWMVTMRSLKPVHFEYESKIKPDSVQLDRFELVKDLVLGRAVGEIGVQFRAVLYRVPDEGLEGRPNTRKEDRKIFLPGLHLRNVSEEYGTEIYIITEHGNSSALHVMSVVGRSASTNEDLNIRIRFEDDARTMRANFTLYTLTSVSPRETILLEIWAVYHLVISLLLRVHLKRSYRRPPSNWCRSTKAWRRVTEVSLLIDR